MLVFSISIGVFASQPKLVDESALLTSEEAQLIDEAAQWLVEQYNMDVLVLTTDSLDGKSATAYADDYYDYQGYGLNESRDGIILLISIGERDWAISSRGDIRKTFNDSLCDEIGRQVQPYLSTGEYYNACSVFLQQVDGYISGELVPPEEGGDIPVEGRIAIAIGLALLVAFIVVMCLRSQLNNARPQPYAHNYISNFRLTRQNDAYLYGHTTMTARQETRSDGHVSSSGATHSGSSGKF